MKKPSPLRLYAEDAEGVEIISSITQDGVAKINGLSFEKKLHRFSIEMNRFNWELPNSKKPYFRTRSLLAVDGVLNVRARNLPQQSSDAVISLLAIVFKGEEEQPNGVVNLQFANNVEIELEVECVDLSLIDSDTSWPTLKKPKHKIAAKKAKT